MASAAAKSARLGEPGAGPGGCNECLTVHADNERTYLNSMGMATHSSGEKHLTLEGTAEHCWDIFMKPLRQQIWSMGRAA